MPYEAKLLTGIFKDGPDVTLSGLKNHFATRLKAVENLLYEDLVSEGWYTRRPDRTRDQVARDRRRGTDRRRGAHRSCWPGHELRAGRLPIVVAGLLLFIGSRWLPRRTAKGYGTLRRVLGFKMFIDESEKDRARFAEQQNIFSEYLPYAVVFGATEKWARAFAGLDGQLPQRTGTSARGRSRRSLSRARWTPSPTTRRGTISSVPASSGLERIRRRWLSGGGIGGGGGGSW